MHHLSPEERTLLSYYVLRSQRTFYAPYHHPVAQSLAGKGIVTPGRQGNAIGFPFTTTGDAEQFVREVHDSGHVPPSALKQLRHASEQRVQDSTDPVRRRLLG